MKTRLALVLGIILIMQISVKSQVKIGDNATTINSASLLELETTNKGFVLPRIALTDVTSSSPLPAGLLKGTVVYDTLSSTIGGSGVGIYYWDGSEWNFLANTTITGNYWSLTGNSGTSPSSNFIGTTDAKDFVARTNNTERMRILGANSGSSKAGWISMGITIPRSSLDVTGDYTNKNVITIQNTSSTGFSSVDMLDNSGNLATTFGFANSGTGTAFSGKAYLNGYGNDFLFTRGSSYDLIMKGSNGYVGLNTSTPSERLHVVGNFYLTGAFMPGGNAGTSGYVLTSAGTNAAPTWNSLNGLSWNLTGNSGTNAATNFIGTTDAVDLVARTNNVERFRITSAGNVGIGLTNPSYKLAILSASNPLYLSGVQATSTFSTDSVLTINAGVVKKTPYSSLTAIAWNLTGNAGTNSAINFLGTTDNHPIKFQVNNTLAGFLDSSGGSGNSFYGYASGSAITTGTHNTATGTQALNAATTANNNTAYGYQALYTSTTGAGNTAGGYSSMYSNTTGQYNTAYGFSSLNSNTTGSYNVAIGQSALQHNTTGVNNAVVGEDGMLSNTTGRYLAGIGTNILYSNTTGSYNTAVGESALFTNTTGGYNIAMGSYTLFSNTTASNNIAFGYYAGHITTTGGNNIFIGTQSGVTNTTGANNTLIGTNSDLLSSGLTNAGAIGYNAKAGLNNSLVLGDTASGGNAVNVGIGVRYPLKRLHIDAAPIGSSGAKDSLKIDNLASSASNYNKALLVIDSATGYVSKQNINTIAANNYWGLTGNSGTNYASNFLGTTDNTSLRFRTNNTEQMIIDSLGHIGIGSSSFNALNPGKLLIDYGTTTSNTIVNLKGNNDDYFQMNLQNTSSGTNSSSDYVATSNDGTDSTYYVDLGINGGNYVSTEDNWGGPHDAYLYTYGRNLVIGSQTNSGDVLFLLGGGKSKTNAVLRLDGATGNLIVGKGENQNNATGNIIRGPNGGSATNIPGGNLTLQGGASNGNTAGGNLNLYGGGTISGAMGSVNINTNTSSATNINTGTSTSDVTIGNASNNINLPKLSATSVVMTDASKNLTSTTPASNSYLYFDGTNFTWASAATLGSFSVTSPLTYNNLTGVFGITKASTTTNGYLSSTDWNTFNNKVGSITLNAPSIFSTPVNFSVASGAATGTLSLNTETVGTVFAGPAGPVGLGGAVPTFRALVASDIPSLASSYIQNQSTVQASSNFNISGNGTIGTNLSVTGTSTLTALVTSKAGHTNIGAFTTSGGIINMNASSNFATNINTGSSTSNITIGNSSNNILLPKFNKAGSLFFTSATTGQIAATGTDMIWDDANNRLGIGTTSPGYELSVLSSSNPLYLSGVQATSTFSSDSILTIYNGVVKKAAYSSLPSGTSGWSLTGNSGTTPGTNFIGTTDLNGLVFKVNNEEAGYLGISGSSYAVAFGVGSSGSSTATQAIAIGASSQATQQYNTALGYNAQAITSSQATAIGTNSLATGFQSQAFGIDAQATSGAQAIALGTSSRANNQYNIAVGYNAQAITGSQTIAIGESAKATSYQAIALGSSAQAITNSQTLAVGVSATASGYQSTAIGNSASASGSNSTAIGNGASTSQANALVLGNSSANVGIGTTTPNTSTKLDVAGSFKLGSSGSVLSNFIKTTVTINPGSMTAGSTVTATATVTGAATGNSVILNPRSTLPAGVLIAYCYISAANTLTVVFTSAVAADPPSTTFDVTLIQ